MKFYRASTRISSIFLITGWPQQRQIAAFRPLQSNLYMTNASNQTTIYFLSIISMSTCVFMGKPYPATIYTFQIIDFLFLLSHLDHPVRVINIFL